MRVPDDGGRMTALMRWLPPVVTLAVHLTHVADHESYDNYIGKLIAAGSSNLLYIKIADNTDNICLKRRELLSPEDKAWHIDRCEKVYYPTRKRLLEALKNLTGEVLE